VRGFYLLVYSRFHHQPASIQAEIDIFLERVPNRDATVIPLAAGHAYILMRSLSEFSDNFTNFARRVCNFSEKKWHGDATYAAA